MKQITADDIAEMGLKETLTVLSARMDEYDRLAKGHRAAPHWDNEEMARLATLENMIECLKARRAELGY